MHRISDRPRPCVRGVIAPLLAALIASSAIADPAPHAARPNRYGRIPIPHKDAVERFDVDRSGRLERTERTAARAWLATQRPNRSMQTDWTHDFDGPRPEPRTISREDVATYPRVGFYDLGVIRTLFLDFEEDDWADELDAFYRTDVEVPATLTVDGAHFPGVGVRYRGNSSYFTIQGETKKSFAIAIDHIDESQRVRGYKTLNLLNGHADPSFMRTVLFSYIANHYVPVPKANFVHLVVNGESWGLYVNDQQLNKEFIAEAFHTRRGARWKVSRNFSGDTGLVYLGPDRKRYEAGYELKFADDEDEAWRRLIQLCRTLKRASPQQLESQLPQILDIDATLWFLALGNVLMDVDGYLFTGSEYALYLDPSGRFHPLLRDNNESFNYSGRRPRGFPTPGPDRAELDPLYLIDFKQVPLVSRVLSVPAWRARYLENCRTLLDEWLDWNKIGPLVEAWRRQLAPLVEADDKTLYGYQAFLDGLDQGNEIFPGLKQFVDSRREYLAAHEALQPQR